MKIFSLESKSSVASLSVLAGFFIERLLFYFAANKYTANQSDFYWIRGYPIAYFNGITGSGSWNYRGYFLNLLFWVLAVFIVLSLVRHFRNKSLEIVAKHN